VIHVTTGAQLEGLKREIVRDIYAKRMILTSVRDRPEGWILHSGQSSPFYIQLRLLSSHPSTLGKVGEALAIMLREEAADVNRLVGVAFAGVPIATAASLASGLPAVHTRKILGVRSEAELKDAIAKYGQHSLIEGEIEDGDTLCLVDDLVTGMESKVVARNQVLEELKKRGLQGCSCDHIAVVIDRHQGAIVRARELNLHLHVLVDLVEEGLPMLRNEMSEEEYLVISDYLIG
jgi:orotate phosphoribosyltransferase